MAADMVARFPEEVHRRFAEAFNEEDVDALLALYEPGASLVPEPGQAPVTGRVAIRGALERVLALKARMTLEPRRVILAGDLALLMSRWTLRGESPDGRPVDLAGETADVVRLAPEGGWRLAVDNPWGSQA